MVTVAPKETLWRICVRYLGDLHALFGSWELAKAGYNAGEMKVLRAMKSLGTSDFWELTRGRFLRDETKNFVPAIHAATLIGRQPERYGFSVVPEDPIRYEQVTVPKGSRLVRLAALSGVAGNCRVRGDNPLTLTVTAPSQVGCDCEPVQRGERGERGTRHGHVVPLHHGPLQLEAPDGRVGQDGHARAEAADPVPVREARRATTQPEPKDRSRGSSGPDPRAAGARPRLRSARRSDPGRAGSYLAGAARGTARRDPRRLLRPGG